MQNASVPFLIGGAYVVEVYAGVSRQTKDFDLYLRPQHVVPQSKRSSASDIRQKKHSRIGWPKPEGAAIVLI